MRVLKISFIALLTVFIMSAAISQNDIKTLEVMPLPEKGPLADTIIMFAGSPKVLIKEQLTNIDKKNSSIKPFIKNGIPYIPLNFIATKLGGTIGWDSQNRTATIIINKRTLIFSVDNNVLKLNKEEKSFEGNTVIYKNRLYIPLNSLSAAFGRSTFYQDGLMVVWGKSVVKKTLDTKDVIHLIEKINYLPTVSNFNKLRNILEKSHTSEKQASLNLYSLATENMKKDIYDDGDRIKSDGKNIYEIRGDRLHVYTYDSGNIKVLKILNYDTRFKPAELYISGKYLAVVGNYGFVRTWKTDGKEVVTITARAIMYEISETETLRKIREIETEGGFLTARFSGNFFYMTSIKELKIQKKDNKISGTDGRPLFKDTAIGKGYKLLNYNEIKYFPEFYSSTYLLISGVNLEKPIQPLFVEALLGAGKNSFVSQQNIYILVTSADTKRTDIYKFSLLGAEVLFTAKCETQGKPINSYSLDEKDNFLRVAMVSNEASLKGQPNGQYQVHIFDEMLSALDEMSGIELKKKIVNAWFSGNRCYFATASGSDPLYIFDLKNVAYPTFLGELNIQAFNRMLLPLDENHIIGIGRNSNGWISGYINQRSLSSNKEVEYYPGLNLAIFDISDIRKPKRLFTELIGDRSTDSEILENRKALYYSADKGLLMFPVKLMLSNSNRKLSFGKFAFQGAYVYTVDLSKGFTLKGRITHLTDEDYLQSGSNSYDYKKKIVNIFNHNDTIFTNSNLIIKANDIENTTEKGMLTK